MHIVHLETGTHYYGGARQVAYLAEGMAARGHRVTLICPPGAAIGEALKSHPAVAVEALACGGDLDFGFVPRLRTRLQRLRPDLLHVHSRRGADTLGGLAARWAGVPAVLSRRVDNPEPRWLARHKYAMYGKVICISQGIAEVLRSAGVPESQLRVVRSALDAQGWDGHAGRDALNREFGLDPHLPVIGVVAQLIERKGHRPLLDALATLKAERWQLLVFGKGPLREALEARVKQLELGERVHFAGFRNDLQRWMGALDVLTHPAYMEGLGIALLQASAAGVAIVASRAGGIPEAVRDDENGLLVSPGDVAGLSAAIARLLQQPALRARLGNAGKALIAREFSVDAMVEGNLAVYAEVRAGAAPSPSRSQ